MEMVDIYNKRREKIGVKERHSLEKGEYRISCHIFFVISKEEFLLQQRSLASKKFPGMWEETGGGVCSGQTSQETVVRECKEELGVDVAPEEMTYVGSYTRVRDIVDIFIVFKDFEISSLSFPDKEAISAKWLNNEQLTLLIEQGKTVPSLTKSLRLAREYLSDFWSVEH